ncbi:MAG: hypothetical protein PHU65_07800 [Actinomycetota bacterium]|nr:hypothetical protein [Actinomycetota bacterium]
MQKINIKDLGEYIPDTSNSVTLNSLKKFVSIPYFIKWYFSSESKKVFPIFLQEISDLNPNKTGLSFLVPRNPFFNHTRIKFFGFYIDKKPVGRVMAFIDYNYSKTHKVKTGWIGHFECIEDEAVAKQILQTAVDYLKELGVVHVTGPAKFNANGEVGLLVNGFDRKPYFMEPYNAPYYADYFEKFGFKKENDWFSMNTDDSLSNGYLNRIENMMGRITERFNRQGKGARIDDFKFRNIDFSRLEEEISTIKNLYNPIWGAGNHPQFTAMTDDEFDVLCQGIRTIAIEELIFIVEKNGVPIGVSVSLPNINEIIEEYDMGKKFNSSYLPSGNFLSFRDMKRDIEIFNLIKIRLKKKQFGSMRILILGVDEKFRKNGIDSQLYYKTAQAAKSMGIRHGSGSQLADINFDILNPLFKIGKKSMTWRVYGLDV